MTFSQRRAWPARGNLTLKHRTARITMLTRDGGCSTSRPSQTRLSQGETCILPGPHLRNVSGTAFPRLTSLSNLAVVGNYGLVVEL